MFAPRERQYKNNLPANKVQPLAEHFPSLPMSLIIMFALIELFKLKSMFDQFVQF